MSQDVAITVHGVSKDFKLPHQKQQSLKGMFLHMMSLGNKTYETQHALKNINFEVKKGEFFGIVGRNGSGKSTMLKILAGIYQPTTGSVKVNGRLVPFIELGVGFNTELSGRDNVYLNGAMLGFSVKEINKKYKDIVAFAELEKFMDQKLKNYSSGMQVRLAFSVATILAESDILLIDEVLAVGDMSFQRKCFEFFTELKAKNKTVVFVSHDMEAVKEYCDRAILIQDGLVSFAGTSQETAREYHRLFTKQEKDNVVERSRWGSQEIVIKNASVKALNNSITLRVDIEAYKTIENPVVGFNVRQSVSETRILGSNTKLNNVMLGRVVKGEKRQIAFTFDNILSESKYSVDIAVVNKSGTTSYDWWENAITFSVQRDRRHPFPVDIDYKIEVIHV